MKGVTYGRTTNQISEVGQQLIMPMRRLPITTGFFLFHQKHRERVLNVQRKAQTRTNVLTNNAEKYLKRKE
jgi:hypothetical protein